MRLFDRPILGEGPRWRRHDEDGILFNMRNSEVGASFDTACGMRIVPLPNAQEVAYHMVDFTPHVGTYTRRLSCLNRREHRPSHGHIRLQR